MEYDILRRLKNASKGFSQNKWKKELPFMEE